MLRSLIPAAAVSLALFLAAPALAQAADSDRDGIPDACWVPESGDRLWSNR